MPAAMSSGPTPQGVLARDRWIFAGACGALVLAAFAPVFGNGFVEVFDDALYISANVHVRQGLTWESVRWALAAGPQEGTYWHPLTWLSLMADVQVFGVRPGPIHAVNVALHLGAALLLFAALAQMTGRRARSAAVALLFAVHPLQVESVAWAVERKTPLAAALGFGALLAYARWVERPRWTRYALALALYAASLLAKPLLVTLPVLLLLLDVWPLGRTRWARPERPDRGAVPAPPGRLVVEKLPFFAIALAVVAIVIVRQVDMRAAGVPFGARIANAFTSCWWYVEKIAWPTRLAPYYPQPLAIPFWLAAGAAAGLAVVTGVLLVARRRLSLAPAVGWIWFLIALAPASGILRAGLWPGMADRFAYFPMIGVLIATVWTVGALVEGSRVGRAAALAATVAAAAVLAARTHVQARLWRDTVTLFRHATAVTEPNAVSWSNLGYALQTSGRMAEARSVFEAMSGMLPDAPEGPVNLGVLLHEQGDLEGAEREYVAALRRNPGCGKAHFNLGLLAKRRGEGERALALFQTAIGAGFREAIAFDQLGQSYLAQGRRAEAERAFREALRVDSFYWRAEARLGQIMAATGRADEAARSFAAAKRHAIIVGGDVRAVEDAAVASGIGAP